MDLSILEDLEAPELLSYIQFLLRQYRVMDSFWYIYLSELLGEATADRLNEKVWGRVPALGARELLERFHLQARGLEGFVQALRYWPWTILVGYGVEARRSHHHRPLLPHPGSPAEAGPSGVPLQGDAPGGV
jgi:hypothetical protein